jgi:hypothetical protein
LVKPIPNKAEMCHFTSAYYKDLILDNEQNDCIVVSRRKQKGKQTKKLVTVKQEGKLKQPPYKLKPPPNTPKQQLKDKSVWDKKPLSTYKYCGVKGHVALDCYSRLIEDKIQWIEIP